MKKQQRKAKVLKIANKALDNKNDEKIVVPEIENKKRKKKEGKKDWDLHKTFFLTMEMDQGHVQRVEFRHQSLHFISP